MFKKRINKHKSQKIQRDEPGDAEDGDNSDDNYNDDDSTKLNSRVEGPVDDSTSNLGVNDDESIDETGENANPHSNGIDSSLDELY